MSGPGFIPKSLPHLVLSVIDIASVEELRIKEGRYQANVLTKATSLAGNAPKKVAQGRLGPRCLYRAEQNWVCRIRLVATEQSADSIFERRKT